MSYFIDAHCHPTLKRYLYGYSIYNNAVARRDNNYTDIQVTVPAMKSGLVDAGISAHYLPEKLILTDWCVGEFCKPFLKVFADQYFEKVERDDAFAQTIDMIDDFEQHIATNDAAIVAHNPQEFIAGLNRGVKVFAQALEGAHHFGRGLTVEQYKSNIDILKSKGIALITLSHFYPNDITCPVEGIAPKTKKMLGMRFTADCSLPLTPLGKEVIAYLLEQGFIVDLTHTNPVSRKEIIELNKERGPGNTRPLVFSHTGARSLFKDEANMHYALMCPDDEEILAIKECNGVIGVIFMNYWLSGEDEKFLSPHDFGFENILGTIKYLATVMDSFDHIAIGTDFDGMADPPDDYYGTSMLGGFKQRLYDCKDELGATDEDIEKILGKNILRVLQEGWV